MAKKYRYTTSGTCSREIEIEIDDSGVISNVRFIGGCAGNTQGVSALACGMRPEQVVERLRGIHCGTKPTSCPDQLALALEQLVTE